MHSRNSVVLSLAELVCVLLTCGDANQQVGQGCVVRADVAQQLRGNYKTGKIYMTH